MQLLGTDFAASQALMSLCEAFVYRMYSQIAINDVNVLRYRLFCSRSTQSTSLPPTRNALVLHVHRANYQAAVWRRALSNTIQPPSPHGHGWIVKKTKVKVEWMTQPAAPAALLELHKCGCSTGCASRRCSCRASLLQCTDACQCKDCSNRPESANENDSESALSGSDSETSAPEYE